MEKTSHECSRKVSSFLTALALLIMISQHQTAPSRYQHIISGLVQPLNHSRHKNPLILVTFSPTQKVRWQSAIWVSKDLSKHCLNSVFFHFLVCLHLLHSAYLHLCLCSNLLVCHHSCYISCILLKSYFCPCPCQEHIEHTKQFCMARTEMLLRVTLGNRILNILHFYSVYFHVIGNFLICFC